MDYLYNTRKDYRNTPRPHGFNTTDISNKKLFLTEENIHNVIASLYGIHMQHGFYTPLSDFKKDIPRQMHKWAIERGIDGFEPLGSKAEDFLLTLDFINRMFIRENYEKITLATPLRGDVPDVNYSGSQYIQVGSVNEFGRSVQKKGLMDLMASDYGSIDVWKQCEVNRWNGHYRDHNKIGIDQISRHSRNYDRSNPDGYRSTIESGEKINNHMRGFGCAQDSLVKQITDDAERHKYIRL